MCRMITVMLLMLTISLGALEVTAGSMEEEIKQCAAESDDAARLSCFDALLTADQQSPSVAPAATTADQQPASVAPAATTANQPEPVAVSTPSAVVNKNEARQDNVAVVEEAITESDAAMENFGVELQKAEEAALKSIESRVVEVRRSSHRKPIIVLENDQIWQQTDGYKLRLKKGQPVVITRGTFSSFFMQGKSGGGRVRVKRIN
jgi:hypothetical protein